MRGLSKGVDSLRDALGLGAPSGASAGSGTAGSGTGPIGAVVGGALGLVENIYEYITKMGMVIQKLTCMSTVSQVMFT